MLFTHTLIAHTSWRIVVNLRRRAGSKHQCYSRTGSLFPSEWWSWWTEDFCCNPNINDNKWYNVYINLLQQTLYWSKPMDVM